VRSAEPRADEDAGSLCLDDEEAELVVAEAAAASRVLPEPRRSEAAALAEHAKEGVVPGELVEVLGELLMASLQGGRARRLYLAEGERVLTRVLRRTPPGRRLEEALEAVNRALGALAGRKLEHLRVAMRTAGHFTVVVQADGVAVTLAVGPEGIGLESLSV
jgi:hypothetical protein